MARLKISLLMVIVISFCFGMSSAAAEYKSFVDEMVSLPFLFEEDPADEFLAEKRKINELCAPENPEELSDIFRELYFKIQELQAKESARFGEEYVDCEAAFLIKKFM